jgi:hypothetical protein
MKKAKFLTTQDNQIFEQNGESITLRDVRPGAGCTFGVCREQYSGYCG